MFKRSLICTLLIAACSCAFAIAGPVQVADAQGVSCSDVIPLGAVEDVVAAGAVGTTLSATEAVAFQQMVQEGGLAALSQGGKNPPIAAMLGAFAAGYAGSCPFWDWVNADSWGSDILCGFATSPLVPGIPYVSSECSTIQDSPEAAQGHSTTTRSGKNQGGSYSSCSASYMTGGGACGYESYTFASSLVCSAATHCRPTLILPHETLTRNIVLGGKTAGITDHYSGYNVRAFHPAGQCRAGSTFASGCTVAKFNDTAAANPWNHTYTNNGLSHGQTLITLGWSCAHSIDHDGNSGTAMVAMNNVGGQCGLPPGTIAAVVTTNNEVDLPAAIWPIYPEKLLGWSRKVVADAMCVDQTSGATTWVRRESAIYYDRQTGPIPRFEVPPCTSGQLKAGLTVTRVPTGVTCASGVVCWPGSKVFSYTVPPSWLDVGTAPSYTICLVDGANCGAPELDDNSTPETTDDVCTWGGNVPLSWCDPEQQMDPSTTPAVALPKTTTLPSGQYEPRTSGQPSTSTVTPVDELYPETDPDPDPTCVGADCVNITIDVDVEEGVRAAGVGSGDSCWDEAGWSWNPVDWVLTPIKCALLWAFVPGDGLGEDFEAFKDSLFAQFPFSMIATAADFLGDMGDSMEGASGTGCFGGTSSWSFGQYGTVNADDVCIGENVTVTSGQRSIVAALMLAPMVYGLLLFTWTMVLGKGGAQGAVA